jgi:hypothetical protein
MVAITSSVFGAPPPDNASDDDAAVTDRIVASMDNVDDVGLLIVWNGDGARTISQCKWSSGQHGSATVDVNKKHLNKGQNYLIFICYNKVYKGTGLFAGGKYSFRFKLKQNGKTVWEKSGSRDENDKEIKYWKVFSLVPNSSGSVKITDKIDKTELKVMTKFIDQLEGKLNRDLDVAVPF